MVKLMSNKEFHEMVKSKQNELKKNFILFVVVNHTRSLRRYRTTNSYRGGNIEETSIDQQMNVMLTLKHKYREDDCHFYCVVFENGEFLEEIEMNEISQSLIDRIKLPYHKRKIVKFIDLLKDLKKMEFLSLCDKV